MVFLRVQGVRPYLKCPGYEKPSELPGDGDKSCYGEVIFVEHMDGGHGMYALRMRMVVGHFWSLKGLFIVIKHDGFANKDVT